MTCWRRKQTGRCFHHQCKFSEDTEETCVDVVKGFCEAGNDCLPACPYSWVGSEPEAAARKAAMAPSTEDES